MSTVRRISRYCRRTAEQGYSTDRQTRTVRDIMRIWQGFYALNLVLAFFMANALWLRILNAGDPMPLWPVFWATSGNLKLTVTAIVSLMLASAIAAALNHRLPAFRLGVALSNLLAFGLYNSFGSMSHGGHIWTWMSLMFVLFPAADEDDILRSRALRMRVVWVFLTSQGLILLFYSLSGLFKLASGIFVATGAISSLSPYALSAHVGASVAGEDVLTMTGKLALDHPWLGWPIFLAVIYIEVFALTVWFRPSLHRLWGASLLLFHVAIWMTMGIHFLFQPVQMLLLLAWSPFFRSRPALSPWWLDLPLVGAAYLAVRGKNAGFRQRRQIARSEFLSLALLAAVGAALFAGRNAYSVIF